MKSQELVRQKQRLGSLEERAYSAAGSEIEMLSHWAKYLCVLSAGFLENAVVEVYGDFVRGAASEPVTNYAISRLRTIRNPKAGLLIQISTSFKKSWGEELETYIDREGRREAINTIMLNRHRIAHGEDSDITMSRVKEYLKKSIEVVEFMESQCRR